MKMWIYGLFLSIFIPTAVSSMEESNLFNIPSETLLNIFKEIGDLQDLSNLIISCRKFKMFLSSKELLSIFLFRPHLWGKEFVKCYKKHFEFEAHFCIDDIHIDPQEQTKYKKCIDALESIFHKFVEFYKSISHEDLPQEVNNFSLCLAQFLFCGIEILRSEQIGVRNYTNYIYFFVHLFLTILYKHRRHFNIDNYDLFSDIFSKILVIAINLIHYETLILLFGGFEMFFKNEIDDDPNYFYDGMLNSLFGETGNSILYSALENVIKAKNCESCKNSTKIIKELTSRGASWLIKKHGVGNIPLNYIMSSPNIELALLKSNEKESILINRKDLFGKINPEKIKDMIFVSCKKDEVKEIIENLHISFYIKSSDYELFY